MYTAPTPGIMNMILSVFLIWYKMSTEVCKHEYNYSKECSEVKYFFPEGWQDMF